jgi:hypothetical protein
MDKMVLSIFQKEVQKQCEFALTSAAYINNTIQNIKDGKSGNQLWYFAQNFLIAAANVSKLLWGSKEKISVQRRPLRDSLDIKENSLLRSRALRNDFEHYDERVETWASVPDRKFFIDSNSATIKVIGLEINQDDYFRNFDTNRMAITFQGKAYELQPIIDELIEVQKAAVREVNKPHVE